MIMNQIELYNQMMKMADKNNYGTIKGAAANVILACVTYNSSNLDEATAQWNELTNWFEQNIKKRFAEGNLIKPDNFQQLRPIINGDR